VVCGAPNVEEGQLAVLAKPGTVLCDGTTVKASDIYGIRSDGMLCSEAELGIGRDKTGIMVIRSDSGCKPGRSLVDALGLSDWILDISVTPNRPDCLSILGVAREISALYGISLTTYQPLDLKPFKSLKPQIPISIEVPDLCPRYAAAVMGGIRIGPSPHWMAMRLQSSGIRPINNVVDVTNYVLIEYGQPLHAFDLDMLKGPAITVRMARPGERINTIDGKDREVCQEMLVIADTERPIALAGVMGGSETEVNNKTERVFLESAWFNPIHIRRTSKLFKMITESSYRFERGIDPEGVIRSLYRTVELISKIAGGYLIDDIKDIYSKPYQVRYQSLRPKRANDILGIDLDSKKMANFLEKVGVELCHVDNEQIRGLMPSYRPDLKGEIDLIEEIARLYRFTNIPTRIPQAGIVTDIIEPSLTFVGKIKNIFVSQGMTEVISYSFMSPGEIDIVRVNKKDQRKNMLKIRNPLSDDQSVMRTSLIPGLMRIVAKNQAQRNTDLRLFEIGTVFYAKGKGELPLEEQRIVALCTGRRYPKLWSWPKEQVDFFDLKGVLEGLLQALGITDWKVRPGEKDGLFYLSGAFAYVILGENSVLGTFGQINPNILDFWDAKGPVFVFDLSFDVLEATAISRQFKFNPLAKYPAVERDIAVIVSETLYAQDLLEYIHDYCPNFLEDVHIFDVYKGEPVPKGFKSLGMRFTYRAEDHTLSDHEVSSVHDPLVHSILQSYNAKLRE
jgi:phenylalanyl-tRNA synthetase beta chain